MNQYHADLSDRQSRAPYSSRKRPAHGLITSAGQATIVFVTVCTRERERWLASRTIHNLLIEVWQEASAWLVGRYVVMPDHIHLFAAPGELQEPLENWIRFWKSQFTRRHGSKEHRWQSGYWDTRLRRSESYDSKWEYVRNNPVRHGLVSEPDLWPFQGSLIDLPW